MAHEIHLITAVSSLGGNNVANLYSQLQDRATLSVKVTWWIVFDDQQRTAYAHWKQKFSKSHNPHLLVNCHISEIRESSLFHVNGIFNILEQQLQLMPEISDQWVYFMDELDPAPPDVKEMLAGSTEETLVYFIEDTQCRVCFRLKFLRGQRFWHPNPHVFVSKMINRLTDEFDLFGNGRNILVAIKNISRNATQDHNPMFKTG